MFSLTAVMIAYLAACILTQSFESFKKLSYIVPLLVIAILLVGNHAKIMKGQRLSLLNNFGLVLITLILIAGSVLLFYQAVTGQGS